MKPTDKIQYIHSYISEELDSSEASAFEAWLNESNENQLLFDQISKVWNNSLTKEVKQFNHSKAFNKHLDLLKSKDHTIITPIESKQQKNIFLNFNWTSVAAIMILMVSVLMVFKWMNNGTEYISDKITSPLALEDGSKVWLDKGAKLKVSKMTKDQRTIVLNGRAYFEIATNVNVPFVIKTKDIEINVTGTSFIVDADEKSVLVKEGQVEVKHDKQVRLLTKNQKVILTQNVLSQVTEVPFENIDLWFNEELKFNNAPFDKVIKDISEKYKIKFELPVRSDWARCTLTSGSLSNNTLEQIMTTLQLTWDMDYKKIDDATYKITKVKCK
ncbi:MAG: FecR family protein [Saprospiraceae bacterium]|nr:FecR family protein [Saprospiraceae bacterium]